MPILTAPAPCICQSAGTYCADDAVCTGNEASAGSRVKFKRWNRSYGPCLGGALGFLWRRDRIVGPGIPGCQPGDETANLAGIHEREAPGEHGGPEGAHAHEKANARM